MDRQTRGLFGRPTPSASRHATQARRCDRPGHGYSPVRDEGAGQKRNYRFNSRCTLRCCARVGELLKFSSALVLLFLSVAAFARDLDKIYKKTDLRIGAQKFSAYLADTEQLREDGLMFIRKIPP